MLYTYQKIMLLQNLELELVWYYMLQSQIVTLHDLVSHISHTVTWLYVTIEYGKRF